MSDQRDDLILGSEVGRARDSDGDGVSDIQEGLDGTDPNDPNSTYRHDTPVLGPDDDPRGNPDLLTLKGDLVNGNIIDQIKSNLPAGTSLDQNLPVGLDGKTISNTHQHYGNADADKMFGDRVDTNSPLNMARNPVDENKPATPSTPKYGNAKGGITEAGSGGDSKSFSSNSYSTPPPGAELGTRAPDMGLVSLPPLKEAKDRTADQRGVYPSSSDGGTKLPDFDKPKPEAEKSWGQKWDEAVKAVTDLSPTKALDNAGSAGTKRMTDPDAGDGGTVVPTEEQLAHAVMVHGAATDVVEGFGGLQIEGDAPPAPKIDLVTDGGADDATEGAITKVTIPGLEISKPVNVHDDIIGGPSPLPHGGDTGAQQASSGQPGLTSQSYSATASDASTGQPGNGTGVINIGSGSPGGGISSVAPDQDSARDDSGDNEDDAGRPADEPTDRAPSDDTSSDTSADTSADTAADTSLADPQVDDAPPLDAPADDIVPAPLDPVADAMDDAVAPYEAPPETSAVDDSQVDLSIPDEPDLDDGF